MSAETNTLLRELIELSRPSTETALSLTSPAGASTSSFMVQLQEPIRPPPGRQLEVALSNLETAYTWPNVANDTFVYGFKNQPTPLPITLPTGTYELAAINAEIQRQLAARGHWDVANQTHYISIEANLVTQRCIISINNPDYQVNINESTLKYLLGWPGSDYEPLKKGHHEAPSNVQISKVNELLLQCPGLVKGGYVSTSAGGTASRGYTLASFFPNVPPGYKVSFTPRSQIWLPVSGSQIQRVRVHLTDQDGRPIDLRGELLTVGLVIRDRPI